MVRDLETKCHKEVRGAAQRRGARAVNVLINAGKHQARKLLKARILLQADASEAGEGWSDLEIAAAPDTSVDTVVRTRQELVEDGLEAVLTRKHSPRSARPRIFDGAAEAKLIALACSPPPKAACPVDIEATGSHSGRVGDRRAFQRQYDWSYTKRASAGSIGRSNG
jgi:hypothetical protein